MLLNPGWFASGLSAQVTPGRWILYSSTDSTTVESVDTATVRAVMQWFMDRDTFLVAGANITLTKTGSQILIAASGGVSEPVLRDTLNDLFAGAGRKLALVALPAGSDGQYLATSGTTVQWSVVPNWYGQTFYLGSINSTSVTDTSNNVMTMQTVGAWYHWPVNHKAHSYVKLSYVTFCGGESVSASIGYSNVPTNSYVLLRFFPGPNPTFKVYAIPLSVALSNPKTGYYGALVATFATNISWCGSTSIIANLMLVPQ